MRGPRPWTIQTEMRRTSATSSDFWPLSRVVLACIDNGEYSQEYPREQWSNLKSGIMVNTDFGGLIHYVDSSQEHITLRARASNSTSF